jgi:hypothetical protein
MGWYSDIITRCMLGEGKLPVSSNTIQDIGCAVHVIGDTVPHVLFASEVAA